MTNQILNKLLFVLLFAMIVLSSCTKKEIAHSAEKNLHFYKMYANDAEFVSEAIAIRCENDTSVYYHLTNNLETLEGGSFNFEEGDFIYRITDIDGYDNRFLGNHGLSTEFTNEEGLTIVRSYSEYIIESVDEQVIKGTAFGLHYKENPNGGEMIEIPFTAEFSAEIVDANDYCQ